MSRVVVLVVAALAACGSPRTSGSRATPSPHRTPTSAAGISSAPPTAPKPVAHKPRSPIDAPHPGAIQMLTATIEGDAALSFDDLGSTRLWPALDGTQEPKLVELPSAKELALAHRTDGFTAVARDETGGLYIAKLDVQGRTLSHVTLGVDPPFAGMTMSTAGLVAWRTDQRILLVDGDGAIRGDIATEAQQRVVDVVGRGTKALALLETDGKVKARWLTLQPTLAWGAWIDHADVGKGFTIALSPSTSFFAIASSDDTVGQVAVFDAATGQRANLSPIEAGEMDLAFVDNDTLAIMNVNRGLLWMSRTGTPAALTNAAVQPVRLRGLIASGSARIIAVRDGELMLITQTQTQFLGYGAMSPQIAAPGPDGTLLVVGAPGPVLFDANLRERAPAPQLGTAHGSTVAALEWVSGDQWLVESSVAAGVSKLRLAIVDIASGKQTVVRDNLPEVHYLAYEPSTKLVTLSFGSQAQVARLDLAQQTLDQIAQTPKRGIYEEIAFAPLAPSLARGLELVDVTIKGQSVVRWIKSAAALDKPTATLAIDGSYLGTDAAGRVYAWHPNATGTLEVGIYTDGKQTGTLPTEGAAALWPDPTATLLAEAGQHAITLYRGSTVVWSRPVEGVHEVHWLSDGALALAHASGIARLDAKTGTMTAVRCGWDFGLSAKPHAPAPRIEPICAQLAR